MTNGYKVAFGVQLALALLFLALGWSQTSSLQFGRTPSIVDIAALAAPLVLVIAGALLSAAAARRGQRSLAQLAAVAPIPLAIVLYMLAGIV